MKKKACLLAGFLSFMFFAAGSATAEIDYIGTDSNNNNIRDDVDSYLSSVQTSSMKRNILIQQAGVLQDIMKLDLENKDSVERVGREYMKTMSCLASVYTVNGEDPAFMRFSREVTEKTFNDKEKDAKFHKFLAKIERMNMNGWGTLGTQNCGK